MVASTWPVAMTVRLQHAWVLVWALRLWRAALAVPGPVPCLVARALNAALYLPRAQYRLEGDRTWRDGGRVGIRLEVRRGH